ncbi:MAG: hypothetical protein HGA45_24445 [Chloroflexales bacterium]|nr:hypothetical protein [Chloroflexales bacterium]
MSDAALWLALICALVLVAAAISVPASALIYWAGWRGRSAPAALVPPADAAPAAGPFLVYLSGMGDISGAYSTRYEDRFLAALATRIPGLTLITDVFPYSIENLSMTSQRHMGRFWGWVNTERLRKGPLKVVGKLIDLRNILHIAVAADARYGPIYGYDTAEMIIQGLLRQGYRLGSGTPVCLLGYSGGAQIALVSASYLHATLRAPVQVISLGGLMNPSPALDQIAALTHFYGTRDTMQRLGEVFFPGRWPLRTATRWARGVAAGTIRVVCLGPMDHAGLGSYLDDGVYLPDGRSYMQITADAVAAQIRQLAA